MSLKDGSWSHHLSSWLSNSFPTNSVDEFQSSIHREILERLSRFFFSLPCAFEREQQLFLSEAKFQVERIPRVLKYMINIVLGEPDVIVDVQKADSNGLKGRRSHQKNRRKMQKQQRQELARLGITDPKLKEEASINVSVLLKTLERTFKVCLPYTKLQHIESI
jgi:hypothetical protein